MPLSTREVLNQINQRLKRVSPGERSSGIKFQYGFGFFIMQDFSTIRSLEGLTYVYTAGADATERVGIWGESVWG